MRINTNPGTNMRQLLLLALVLASANACHRIDDYPQQPKTLRTCTAEAVMVYVKWVKDVDEIAQACKRSHLTYGCTTDRWTDVLGYRHARLVLVQPKDFNQGAVLAAAGHELCHGLDGEHE